MNKQKIVLTASGIALAALAAGGIALLVSSSGKASAARESRDSEESKLKRLYSADPFPSAENIAAVDAGTAEVTGLVARLRAGLSSGSIAPSSVSPAIFKQNLETTVLGLRAEAPIVDGVKCVQPDFVFGFGRYLGETGGMPAADDVPRLNLQLATVGLFAEMVYGSRISEWKTLERETFEAGQDAQQEAQEEEAPRRGRGRNRRSRGGDDQPAARRASSSAERSDGALAETYVLEVSGRQLAILDLLNRIAACPTCMIATEVQLARRVQGIRAYVPPVAKAGAAPQQSAPAEEAAGADGEYEFINPSERIVSGPEIDQLIDARIEVEVLHFQPQPTEKTEKGE